MEENKSTYSIKILSLTGFGIAAFFAVRMEWSLQEFCWSSWLTGLFFAWACILISGIEIILSARSEKAVYENKMPFIAKIPPLPFLFLVCGTVLIAGYLSFRFYNFLFAFYGIFLSVFAGMEPDYYFGENGFINSNFFSPVAYLAVRFWPMALGAVIARSKDLLGEHPWKRLGLPMQKEIVRLHIITLVLPFVSLLAWLLLGDFYQPFVVVVLMAIYYFMQ
jgi:hypothetical protein